MTAGLRVATAGLALLCVAASGNARSHGIAAQSPPVVEDVRLSADTVEIGDRVDLRFSLRLPDGTVAFLPDSLATGPVESFQPVEWAVDDTTEAGARISVIYPLIVFGTGALRLPELDVFVAPREESTAAGLSAEGAWIGSWADFREAPSATPSARLLTVPGPTVEALSVLRLDDITTQLAPRPPADVSGASREWVSSSLVAVFGLLLLGVVTVSALDWMETRNAQPPAPPPSARDEALRALDALLERGHHRDGELRTFYAEWSDIVRRYVEEFVDEWGPAWTSTELISDLQGRRRGVAIERALTADAIAVEMRLAEEVKFGGLRPDAETAERHLRQVREWIEGSRLPADRGDVTEAA